jgi:nucleotide-binding universal stress UspA family protein
MSTLLLATDGSPSAQAAASEAIELARATGRQLRVVTVWRTPVLTGFGYAPVPYLPELGEIEREHAEDVARGAVAEAAEHGVAATWELREGDAADEICAVAAETAATMVVIGAHGWGPLQRLVFGSVSTAVLHHAPCAVLVVRGVEEPVADKPAKSLEAAHR